jgi:hypothetical protein
MLSRQSCSLQSACSATHPQVSLQRILPPRRQSARRLVGGGPGRRGEATGEVGGSRAAPRARGWARRVLRKMARPRGEGGHNPLRVRGLMPPRRSAPPRASTNHDTDRRHTVRCGVGPDVLTEFSLGPMIENSHSEMEHCRCVTGAGTNETKMAD